jgi:8-oxo-dGTP diphosphatase
MTISRSEDFAGDVIRIVAAVVMDEGGKTLLVRKRGTQAFMQPGGKFAPGEMPLAALVREIREELGCEIVAGSDRPLGRFIAPAANEANSVVDADLFAIRLLGDPLPQAEIDEMIWLDPHEPTDFALAPLTRTHVLPAARTLAAGRA